jgi:hypothetical protein
MLTLLASQALGQSTVKVCIPTGVGNSCQDVTSTNPFYVTTNPAISIGTVNQGTSPWVVGGTVALTASTQTIGNVNIAGLSYNNISAYTNTVVKLTPGVFGGLSVNSAGTTSTAVVYDNTACSGSIIGTFTTTAQGAVVPVNAAAATGICVATAGSLTPANLTVLYR